MVPMFLAPHTAEIIIILVMLIVHYYELWLGYRKNIIHGSRPFISASNLHIPPPQCSSLCSPKVYSFFSHKCWYLCNMW